MKIHIQKIMRFLISRLGRNIIFWVFLICDTYGLLNNPKVYPVEWYYLFRSLFLLWILIGIYANNLFFIPRFLVKKKYLGYAWRAAGFTLLMAILFAATENIMLHYFPKMEIYDVSLVAVPIVTEKTFVAKFIWDVFFAFDGLALTLFAFSMAWFMNDYARQRRIASEAEKKRIETELNFLKSQLNPHFLFNTLNNMYGLALKKSDETPEVILQLSSILRYVLYESNTDYATFEKEKELMDAYIKLELLRMANKSNMNFHIEADASYNIPPLLWLPVLENTFKHGTRFISDEHFIDYRFVIENNIMTVYSRNRYKNGAIMDKTGGIGLQNLKKRLDLLYGNRYSIDTHQDDEYYTLKVTVSLA